MPEAELVYGSDGLPFLGVLPTRDVPSIKSLDLTGQTHLLQVSFEDAFHKKFDSDAHFVTYQLDAPQLKDMPFRISKSLYGTIREHGAEIWTTCFAFDIDTEGHEELNQQNLGDILQTLVHAYVDLNMDMIGQWTVLYTTKHGIRLVYALEEPIPAYKAEPILEHMISIFHAAGVNVDDKCKDWTRIFRLPNVLRNGEQQDQLPYYKVMYRPDYRLGPEHLPQDIMAVEPEAMAALTEYQGEMPSEIEAQEYLWENQEGKTQESAWYKKAKKRLKNRECYPCIFESESIADKGSRNDTIFRYAGQVVSLLHNEPDATAEKCYALLLPSVLKLDPDPVDVWPEVLWRGITQAWQKEEAKKKKKEQEEEAEKDAAVETWKSIISGLQEWLGEIPVIQEGDIMKVSEFMRPMLLVRSPNPSRVLYHIMTPEGYYTKRPEPPSGLVARIRELGMDRIMNLETIDSNGNIKTRPPSEICATYGCQSAEGEHGVIGCKGVYLKWKHIEGVHPLLSPKYEHKNRQRPDLFIQLYDINPDIPAVYNQDVQTWLELLPPKDQKEKFFKWLALWPILEQPICALSIMGPHGCGKSLLTTGLTEMLTPLVAPASAKEITGRFMDRLFQTPIIHINEDVSGQQGAKALDAAFKEAVGDDVMSGEVKFGGHKDIVSKARVLITSNEEVIHKMSGDKSLGPTNRDAIGSRVFHFMATQAAADFLENLDGKHKQVGNRWVRDGTGQSDFVLAKHLKWIHENYLNDPNTSVPAGRWLVMGDPKAEIIQRMAISSGRASQAVEAVVSLFANTGPCHGLSIDASSTPARAFITMSQVKTAMRKFEFPDINNSNEMSDILKGICKEGVATPSRKELPDGTIKNARWWELDLEILLKESQRQGYPCNRLEALVTGESLDSIRKKNVPKLKVKSNPPKIEDIFKKVSGIEAN